MNVELYWLLPTVVALCAAFLFLGWSIAARVSQNKISIAEERAREIIEVAEKEAENLKKEKLLEVKDEWFRKKQEAERDLNRQRNKLHAREKQLASREENLNAKYDVLNKKEAAVKDSENLIQERKDELEARIERVNQIIAEQTEKLERVSGLSRDDARNMLIENLTNDAKLQAAQQLKEIRDEMKRSSF